MSEPVDECGQCGADLYLNVEHQCLVGGNTVVVVWAEGKETDMEVTSNG